MPHTIPVFVTLSFATGIILGFQIHLKPLFLYSLSGSIAFLFLFAFFRAKFQFFQDLVFGISAFLLLVLLGIFTSKIHQPTNNPEHYIQQDLSEAVVLQLEIREKLKPNPYQDNYVAEVKLFNKKPTEGKILLSLRKDSLFEPLKIDDRIALKTKLTNIYQPLNPHQFNYAEYMANKHILKRVKALPNQILKLKPDKRSIAGIAAKVRKHIDKALVKNGFSDTQIPIIEALLLGQKKDLDKSTYANFAAAGVVHILAVSGLHIGILLFFLLFLFKPLTYLPHGKLIRTLLVIALLWAYACLAGLSPSILRAVTMFSCLSFGLFFQRKTFVINMLCLSAFILLLYNPNFILEVGFQLSYSAVLAIILFQNKIFKLLKSDKKIFTYPWRITSVTLAAQLGVLPLSLFYFHQFPGLFFLTNLLIIPFLGLILGVGIFVILFSLFDWIPHILVEIYGGIIDGMQFLVDWVADQNTFLIKHVYFPTEFLVLAFLSLVLLAFSLYRKQKIYAFLFLAAVIAFQSDYIFEHDSLQKKRQFYVFYKSRHTLLGFRHGDYFELVKDKSAEERKYALYSSFQSFRNAEAIEETKVSLGIQNYYCLGSHKLFVIDSSGIWRLPKSVKPSEILLRNSPKINLERMLDSLKPKLIIADGSNYRSLVSRWRETCKKMKVPFHYTGKKGALTLVY